MTRYREVRVGGCLEATVERQVDGSLVLRSTEALQAYPARLSDRLEHWACEAPNRTLVAQRGADGPWLRIGYAQMLARVQRIGQALVERPLWVERPIAILSDNDLDHLCLALAAMWVGIPYAPVSPAYSLLAQDHAKLRHIFATLTPGLVFASTPAYARAIQAVAGPGVEVVLASGSLEGRTITPFANLLPSEPGPQAEAAHAATGPDTIVKFLFTSGSTEDPAVEPHLRRQPQRGHHASTTAARCTSTPASRRPRAWPRRCATCARSRRRSISTCPRASRKSSPRWTTTRRCARCCSATCRPSCSPVPGCCSRCGTGWTGIRRRRSANASA